MLADGSDRFPAGHRHRYSNPGYAVLGALIERLRARPWHEALRTEVLQPLGMTDTGTEPGPRHASGWAVHPWADVLLPEPAESYGPMAPAGQLWSSAADLCRWAAFLISGDQRVLRADTVAEMRAAAAPPDNADPDLGYGLGMQLLRHGGHFLAGHTGSVPGHLAALWCCPDEDVAAVVLANVTAGVPIGHIAADLVHIVAEHEPVIPPAWQPSAPPEEDLLDLIGPWYWGPAPLLLRLTSDRTLRLTGFRSDQGTRLRPDNDGTWTCLDGYYQGQRLRVVPDPTGGIRHLTLGAFVLTRTPYDPHADVPGGVDPDGWRATSSTKDNQPPQSADPAPRPTN